MTVNSTLQGSSLIATIDNGRVNIIDTALRKDLLKLCNQAAEFLAQGRIDRLILTGSGNSFVAGADLREFDHPPQEPHLPDVIQALTELPAIAALNGTTLGGGLELALACRLRIASSDIQIGLPETQVGVIPGAGGTQRLFRLVGIPAAARMIANGEILSAERGHKLGLIDILTTDVVQTALDLPTDTLSGRHPDLLEVPVYDKQDLTGLAAEIRRRQPGQVAPLIALDLVLGSENLPLAEGLAKEREAFLRLRNTSQARALRYAFLAERAARKPRSADTSITINTALVAGGGTMGASIAFALALNGIRSTILETDTDARLRAQQRIEDLIKGAELRGKLTREKAQHLRQEGISYIAGDNASLPAVDIAIEAVFENMAVKQQLFSRLAQDLPRDCLLATNTSYLDPNAIFDGIASPERCIGLHFFAPAHVMRLLEIVPTSQTAPKVAAACFVLAQRMGKVAVQSGICDGFIGNRLLRRNRCEANNLLLEGATPAEVDQAQREFGMPMGVFEAQDLSGLDIAYANRKSGTGGLPMVADRLVEQFGRLGRKSGGGWYDYPDGKPQNSPQVANLLQTIRVETGMNKRSFSADEIMKRLNDAQLDEARAILHEGIAQSPEAIDLVLLHGYGFPRWRGGLLFMAHG